MNPEKRTVGALLAGAGKALCYLLLFLLMQALVSLAYTLTAQIHTILNPGSGIDPWNWLWPAPTRFLSFPASPPLFF